MNLVCYLTLPPGTDKDEKGRPDSPVPLVLDVHGGPWGRDSWGLNPQAQFLANRGYAVLSVNFRGSTGFGKKFLNAGNKEWAGKMHDDLLDAVDWAVKEEIADPARVAILGGTSRAFAPAGGLAVPAGKIRLRRGHRGPVQHRDAAEPRPAVLGSGGADVQDPRRRPHDRGGQEVPGVSIAADV